MPRSDKDALLSKIKVLGSAAHLTPEDSRTRQRTTRSQKRGPQPFRSDKHALSLNVSGRLLSSGTDGGGTVLDVAP